MAKSKVMQKSLEDLLADMECKNRIIANKMDEIEQIRAELKNMNDNENEINKYEYEWVKAKLKIAENIANVMNEIEQIKTELKIKNEEMNELLNKKVSKK